MGTRRAIRAKWPGGTAASPAECSLLKGQARPEHFSLACLPESCIVQQSGAFGSARRVSAPPHQGHTPEERQIARWVVWYSAWAIKWVVEAERVLESHLAGWMRNPSGCRRERANGTANPADGRGYRTSGIASRLFGLLALCTGSQTVNGRASEGHRLLGPGSAVRELLWPGLERGSGAAIAVGSAAWISDAFPRQRDLPENRPGASNTRVLTPSNAAASADGVAPQGCCRTRLAYWW